VCVREGNVLWTVHHTLYSKHQQDALFTVLLPQITCTVLNRLTARHQQLTVLYVQQSVYVMCLCWLAASGIGVELKVNSASCSSLLCRYVREGFV
jgi:hypothetical protein